MFKKASPLLIVDAASPVNVFGFLQQLAHGRIVNYRPPPPVGDVLESPILLHQPPRIVMRQRKLSSRLLEVLVSHILNDEQRTQKELHLLIAGLLASIWPETAADLKAKGWISPFGRSSSQKTRVRHPYHLNFAFDALISVPKDLQTERRALELILCTILREYKQRISMVRDEPFSFEIEARRYGLTGYRIERQIRMITHHEELAECAQKMYNCYFNAVNYYQYSLISGEPLANDGTMFSIYCRSLLFNAHVGDNGRISDRLPPDQLPDRERVMFFVLRDAALRRRYNRDPDYAGRVKSLVKIFPRRRATAP